MANVVEALEAISGTNRRLEWSVRANLDIPLGIDVSKKQDITVVRSIP